MTGKHFSGHVPFTFLGVFAINTLKQPRNGYSQDIPGTTQNSGQLKNGGVAGLVFLTEPNSSPLRLRPSQATLSGPLSPSQVQWGRDGKQSSAGHVLKAGVRGGWCSLGTDRSGMRLDFRVQGGGC